jgi:putative ABC transport system permease protein
MLQKRDYGEIVQMALDTIWSNKLRSFLTVLAIVIGIAAVITIASFVHGLSQDINASVEQFGTDIVWAFRFDFFTFGRPPEEVRTRKELTREDGEAMKLLPHAKYVSEGMRFFKPEFGSGTYEISYEGHQAKNVILEGDTASVKDVYDLTLAQGRWFTATEDERSANVVILGHDTAQTLFGLNPAVGKELKIESQLFSVIGVAALNKSPISGGQNPEDNIAYFPLSTMRRMHPEIKDHLLSVKATTHEDMPKLMDEMRELLRRRRKLHAQDPDNFAIMTQDSLSSFWGQITNGLFIFLFSVASVGLLVGGVGVMNIMLVAVTERTREIGVRKAVGARKRDILFQFTLEAITLTGVGGLLGILIGAVIVFLVKFVLSFIALSWLWVFIAFGISCSIGMVFGIYPAWKAANLDPIEALRYE